VAVDAGDSLSHAAPLREADRPGAEARARVILSALGRAGVAAAGVGERDLALGVEWLSRAAREASVPLLAANLRLPDGARPFEPHRIVEVGGQRVGIFAVLARGALPPGVAADDPAVAARAEAHVLRAAGATFVIALLHLGFEEARALISEGLAADVAIVAHEGRRTGPEPVGPVLLAGPADRGRDLAAIVLHLATGGRWADLGAPRRAEAERDAIERWIGIARERLARAESEADRKSLADFIALQEDRAADASRRARAQPAGRLFEARVLPLAEEAAEDPATSAEVDAVRTGHGSPPDAQE